MSKKTPTKSKKRTPKRRKPKHALIPKLRFPEFRDAPGWSPRTLGTFLNERVEFPQEPVPLFSLTIEDGVTPKTERYERAFLVKDAKDAYKLMLPDDFAFNPMNLRFGAIGRHSGAEPVAVSKYYNIFSCDPTVDVKFCEFYFRSDAMIAFYDNMAIGSLIEKRRVHFNDFLKFGIPFPTPAEQTKIAECLSSLDELIGAESRKLEVLQAHKKGLMQQLFPREGETLPRLRFPEFKDAPEWKKRKLGKISRVIRGSSPRPKGDPRYYGGPVPRLMVQDVTRDGKWVTPCIDYLTLEGAELSRPCPAGTLTIVCSGTVGVVSFLAVDACIHDGFLALVDIDKSAATKEFLYQRLGTLRERFQKGATHGGVFTNLTTTGIKEFEVLCPSEREQTRIADFLTVIDDLATAQAKKLDTLSDHKKGLMQQLFPSLEDAHA